MKATGIKVVLAFCFGLMFSASASARDFAIDRLEPASWWVGMKHSRVELMVHGNGIGPLKPRLSQPGVSVVDVQRVANPNYLFVTLEIEGSASPGIFDIEFVDGDRVAARHPFRLDTREAGSAARKGFDASDAIYLITPDRFANGDPGNDSVAAMREPADRVPQWTPRWRHRRHFEASRLHRRHELYPALANAVAGKRPAEVFLSRLRHHRSVSRRSALRQQ